MPDRIEAVQAQSDEAAAEIAQVLANDAKFWRDQAAWEATGGLQSSEDLINGVCMLVAVRVALPFRRGRVCALDNVRYVTAWRLNHEQHLYILCTRCGSLRSTKWPSGLILLMALRRPS